MFTCRDCGNEFTVGAEILERYPGWTPRQCLDCKNSTSSATAAKKSSATKGRDLSIAEVLDRYTDGPDTGVFTDGAAEGNPGPGGWGAVHVVDGQVVDEAFGSEGHTTNNRMELMAMTAGLRMLPLDSDATVYTDSQLVVNILTKWAQGWRARGWTKKSTGPIKNLELVKEVFALATQRPNVNIEWVKAHAGNRWNEYADALATAYRRAEM